MEQPVDARRNNSRALAFVVAGVLSLVGASLGGGVLGRDFAWVGGTVGFVGFVLGLGRAMVLWHVNDIVFDRPRMQTHTAVSRECETAPRITRSQPKVRLDRKGLARVR